MTYQPPIPRGELPPRVVAASLGRSLLHQNAAASVRSMDVVILQLREQKRDAEADAVTQLRDEWARLLARVVEATP